MSTLVEVTLARARVIQARRSVGTPSSLVFLVLMSYYTGVLGQANARIER